ncbi:unnamed protein product [Vicia faba]|uniref:Uncharacterized protein n=1 Tax=Vicia faba TaxID=3906 RepID=A0AAV0ZBM4_VICFA|nr:unnamed protein product [Vicia faba]
MGIVGWARSWGLLPTGFVVSTAAIWSEVTRMKHRYGRTSVRFYGGNLNLQEKNADSDEILVISHDFMSFSSKNMEFLQGYYNFVMVIGVGFEGDEYWRFSYGEEDAMKMKMKDVKIEERRRL